jgi:predicted nucleotidyltransferase
VFTSAERERIRAAIVERARDDHRITGVALTGSAAIGREDAWSDIDLAFGVTRAADVAPTLADWSAYMYETLGVVDHLDVASGAWIYRVFLLANTLQVDLAFAPASDFGARRPTFRLLFGEAATLPHVPPPAATTLIGYAWLYALHARSSLARGRLWQAEYMVSAMRDQALALACLRHGEDAREARGIDMLPGDVRDRFASGLVRDLTADEIRRAFRAVTGLALEETRHVDAALARRIEPVMIALAAAQARPSR